MDVLLYVHVGMDGYMDALELYLIRYISDSSSDIFTGSLVFRFSACLVLHDSWNVATL